MHYSKEIIDVLFPFLERPIEDEWELIKQKKSTLSNNQRKQIVTLCKQLEHDELMKSQQKEHVHTEDCKHDE